MGADAPASQPGTMKGISLDLSRMARAMVSVTQNWDAIHVAGTNGKGSVCTYISALCRRSRIDHGLFTSPYLVDPWDAIKINGAPIASQAYNVLRQRVLDDQRRRQELEPAGHPADDKMPSSLTEFELGTLIAFSAFDDAEVRAGIVEVGLGGRLDSTNALRRKKVTVITKIGLDHQNLLGDTLPKIAAEKAGIMMANVPCVVDGSNPPEVLEVFTKHAQAVGAPLHVTTDQKDLLTPLYNSGVMTHQAQNMACAIAAFRIAFPDLSPPLAETLPLLQNTKHLGRLSWLDVSSKHRQKIGKPILIDGAHNPQSAGTLSAYVEKHVRQGDQPITWVMAMSNQDGKDAEGMFRTLVRPGDRVMCVSFSRRPTMPWVQPVDPTRLRDVANKCGAQGLAFEESNAKEGSLCNGMAAATEHEGRIVLTGSLYLVGDAYRLYEGN